MLGEPRLLGCPECFLGLLPRLREHRLERPGPLPLVDLGGQHRVVPHVERDRAGGGEAHPEPVADTDPKPLGELADDPVAPMPGVPTPAIRQPAGRDVGLRSFSPLCECRFVEFHPLTPSAAELVFILRTRKITHCSFR